MKTNEELQNDVQRAIKWEPLLHAAEVGVTVKDGFVTLSGTVDAYFKKTEAENAAKNVAGVKAVVENIHVVYHTSFVKTDNDIAAEAIKALSDSWTVPNDKIMIKVEDGKVTLDGTLAWNYQREAAKDIVVLLPGVTGVTNNIKIKSEVHDAIEKKDIEDALNRNWSINATDINVTVNGTHVRLTGAVSSLYQKEQAGKMAWNTPGVWSVDNDLVIEYDYSYIE